MDIEERMRNEPENPVVVLEYAKHLYGTKDYRSLEDVFGKYLKRSYDLDLWMVYIEYVKKVSQKKFRLYEVYEFTLSQFENYWGSYGIYREYIEELGKIEDEQTRIEKTRNAYMRGLQIPMGNLPELWKEFESFELELNKITGKKIVSETLPIFQSSFQRYQTMVPLIRSWSISSAAKLIDMEMENGLKLSAKTHGARMQFIYNYVISSFHCSEEAYFFYSEYLMRVGQKEEARKVVRRGMGMSAGVFLPLYYGLVMEDEGIYNEVREKYSKEEEKSMHGRELDIVGINHLNYTLKKKGLECFRKLFIELNKEGMGPCVFIYCALVEYYVTGNRTVPYNIFSSGLLKHPDSSLLKEEFFLFLLRIGDEENARALFKRLEKTNKMWDMMIEYEFMAGSMEAFRELTEQKMGAIKSNEILPDVAEKERRRPVEGVLGKYYCFLDSFNFLGMEADDSGLLDELLSSLPQISPQNNVLSNVRLERIVDILKTMQ